MLTLQIGIGVFIFIELLNIMMLYGKPSSSIGNALGVFNDYHEITEDKKMFVSYLVNWVAGSKLIFVMLGVVIIIWGDYYTQLFTCVAMILSILSFYFKLYPIIKKLDGQSKITPKGYSKTLNYMIISFIALFLVVILVAVFY